MLSRIYRKRRQRVSRCGSLAIVIGFSPWKEFIKDWLPNRNVVRTRRDLSCFAFFTLIVPRLLMARQPEVYVWGFKAPTYVAFFCQRFEIPLIRVEDGFIRSVALGASKAPPLSLCMDAKTLYFDATTASTLEDILNNYDFANDHQLMKRADKGINAFLELKLSKYNTGAPADAIALYGPKQGKRVLVLGQVEGDMSILKGCDRPITNNELVSIAASENPDAQIIYKPHPEVIRGTRQDSSHSSPRDVEHIADVIYEDISLADALDTVDHVYTITSLSGFEALLRGIRCTCLGAPFYAGWGLTDDRQPTPRRKRRLTIEQLFAGSYILYPQYYDPVGKRTISFESAIQLLHSLKLKSEKTANNGSTDSF
ncbi:MAG TPA: hypothetical protein VIR65_02120 [Rhizorhapis sp.]